MHVAYVQLNALHLTVNLASKQQRLVSETHNLKPTQNLKPKTQNLKPKTQNLKKPNAKHHKTPLPAFSKKPNAGARGRVAAHPRKPLVSETKGLRGWAATVILSLAIYATFSPFR